jgi:hypothetical protein
MVIPAEHNTDFLDTYAIPLYINQESKKGAVMKRRLCVCSIIMLIFVLGYGDQLYRSGNYIVDKESGSDVVMLNGRQPSVLFRDTVELLENGGFETCSLPPWESYVWQVTDVDSHSGQYCVADIGNNWMRQNITPILTDSILSITFWSRQPEATIQAFDFIYNDSTYDEDIIWNQIIWQQFDITSYLPSGKTMVALRFWGYSGGGPLIDSTYMDDISIMALSEGQHIEETRSATQQPALIIHPNPVRDKAMIECTVAPGEGYMLSIYDIKGTSVEQTDLENGEYIWHTRGLASGVYFVRIQTRSGQGSMQKVLVIK